MLTDRCFLYLSTAVLGNSALHAAATSNAASMWPFCFSNFVWPTGIRYLDYTCISQGYDEQVHIERKAMMFDDGQDHVSIPCLVKTRRVRTLLVYASRAELSQFPGTSCHVLLT